MLNAICTYTVISMALLASTPVFGADKSGPPFSFGIVYPSMSMAPIDNPAYLAVTKGDAVEALAMAPITYNEESGNFEKMEDPPTDSPVWLTYGGSPNPFGLGMAIQVANDEPIIYFGGGFGIDRFQVGYIFRGDPANDERQHNYTFRIGNVTGPAASLRWSEDEAMTAGLAYAGKWFVVEMDGDFSSEYEGDPRLMITAGLIAPMGGIYAGYFPQNWENMDYNKDNSFAGLNLQFTKNFALNLYYKRYFAEFVLGLQGRI